MISKVLPNQTILWFYGFPSADSSSPSVLCFSLHSLNLLFLRIDEHKDQIAQCRRVWQASSSCWDLVHLPVPDGKLHVWIDLDVKHQFKWWHRLSSIYNLLEITECQSLFMLNLRLPVREAWLFHTILKLVILCAFLKSVFFKVFAMPTANVEAQSAALCTCSSPPAELHSLLEDPQCLVLV